MIEKRFQVLRRQQPWRQAYFYQKSEVLYQLTFCFCKRFLPLRGDRTVDQMVQAARSGKQNIVEGMEDGVASSEMQIKLLNVARSSLQELREDYRDYLASRQLAVWTPCHERYERMQQFCKRHNRIDDYQPFLELWSAEEMANVALTLCYMTDAMLNSSLRRLEEQFVTEGGIKERMHAARTGYRQEQDRQLDALKERVAAQAAEIARLKALLARHGLNPEQ